MLSNQRLRQNQSHLLLNHGQDDRKQVCSRKPESLKKIQFSNSPRGDKKVKIFIPSAIKIRENSFQLHTSIRSASSMTFTPNSAIVAF